MSSNWTIDKTFEFCYGHRVWTQELDGRFSDDLQCACRHLHGHEAKLQVFLELKPSQAVLNKQGMVTDFRHLEFFKRWINKYIDHRFIIDKNDPLYSTLFPNPKNFPRKDVVLQVAGQEGVLAGKEYDTLAEVGPLQELYGGLLLVDFPPTSENLSAWVFQLLEKPVQALGCQLSQVDWWETPKSRSSYKRTGV